MKSFTPSPRPKTASRGLLCFGPFTLDPATGDLFRSGERLRLQPQPARVLVALARRAGELVTREELEEILWGPDTHVDRDLGLNYCIRQIRATLGGSGSAPSYIETLPRRGYRFIVPVERVPRPEPAAPERPPRRRWPASVAAGLVLLVAVAVLVLFLDTEQQPTPAEATGPAAPGAARDLLAVLPLRSIGDDDGSSWFAEGLTEELTSRLGQLASHQLGIVSRTSSRRFPSGSAGVREIGEALGTDYLLEGSVRRSGDRVRVSLRLIQVADQTQLWSATYERTTEDVFEAQREVARDVGRALSLELSRLAPDGDGSSASPEAFESFLQGMHLLGRRGEPDRALPYLRRAAELDPADARAWFGLAWAYQQHRPLDWEHIELAEEAARRAVELDPDKASAHLLLAVIALYHRVDPDRAVLHLERALEINPSNAKAHHQYGTWLAIHGRHGEAREAILRALRLDPLSLSVQADLGWFALYERDYDSAVHHLRSALEVASGEDSYWSRRGLLGIWIITGQWREAEDLVTAWPADAMPIAANPPLAVEARPEGPRATVEAFLRHEAAVLEELFEQGLEPSSNLAWNLALLGEKEAALDWLEGAADAPWGWQRPFLRIDPRVDSLRGDPRFDAVVDRLGLPEPSA